MTTENDELHNEEWRVIPGSEGRYEVSNLGNLRTWYYRRGGRRQAHPKSISTYISSIGYVHCKLFIDGKSRTCSPHRMVMLAFVGPSDLEVNHIDGNKLNNRLDNLQYMTHSENIRHSIDVLGRKLGKRGERSPLAKLSDDQVFWVRQLAADGYSNQDLARIFGISHNHVCVLKNNHIRADIVNRSMLLSGAE